MKKLHLKHFFSRSEVPIHSKEKSPPRPRIWDSQHSFVATKNPKNKKNDFLENFYKKMKFEKKRNFTKILENLRRKWLEKFGKWKCEKREIERKRDLRKYFEALEKNGLTSSGSILFQNEFFEILEIKTFFSTRRKSKKSSKKIEKYFSNDE